MNESKKIEWCDFTWNPITGCLHGCDYCYARAFARRGLGRYYMTGFTPCLHLDRLDAPKKRKKPAKIVVGNMGDLLGFCRWGWTEDGESMWQPRSVNAKSSYEVCRKVAGTIEAAPQHEYFVLTKADLSQPEIAVNAQLLADAGAWIGTSVTGETAGIPSESIRLSALGSIQTDRKFVSLEPLIGDYYLRTIKYITAPLWSARGVKWVIIGGMTGRWAKKYPKPDEREVEAFIRELQANGIAVFVKDNLGFMADVRQWPEGMEG